MTSSCGPWRVIRIIYLIKNRFFSRHDPKTKDTGPVFFGIDITFGLRPSVINDVRMSDIVIISHCSPDTDRCLLRKVVVSLGEKTFNVGAGLAERILEVIVLV